MAAGGAAAMPTTGLEFFAQECAVCHGANGEGVDLLGPEIQHPPREFATWVVRNGRTHPDFAGAMVAYGTDVVSDEWLNEILDYLNSQPQPTTAEALYLDYCANCHGADGAGGVTMRPIINESQNVQDLVRNGHGGQDYGNRREYMPVFSQMQLSDAEVTMLQQYVQGL